MNYDDYGLPTEVVYLGKNICETIKDFMDEEVIADVVSETLTEEYGYCHNGFEYEYLYDRDGVPTAVVVYAIEWDYDEMEELYDEEFFE